MGFWEGLCAFTALVILGLYGLLLLSAKLGLMEDEKKNAKKAYKEQVEKAEKNTKSVLNKDEEKFFTEVRTDVKKRPYNRKVKK